jgi:hypothetical protein
MVEIPDRELNQAAENTVFLRGVKHFVVPVQALRGVHIFVGRRACQHARKPPPEACTNRFSTIDRSAPISAALRFR